MTWLFYEALSPHRGLILWWIVTGDFASLQPKIPKRSIFKA